MGMLILCLGALAFIAYIAVYHTDGYDSGGYDDSDDDGFN
jgi:hypothetical protein